MAVKRLPSDGMFVGQVTDWPGPVANIPKKWLASYGQSLLRASYPLLFNALIANLGTVTMTSASPAVLTRVAHGLVIGDPVFLETTGALYTGLTADVTYYVKTVPSADTFSLGTTRTVSAITGVATVTTAVNTSGSQSGVHTLFYAPHGVADATHFYAPDYRGRHGIGRDDMGGSDASTIGWDNIQGLPSGEATHLLVTGEAAQKAVSTGGQSADHAHYALLNVGLNPAGLSGGGTEGYLWGNDTFSVPTNGTTNDHTHAISGASAAGNHNTMQPGVLVTKIIYAGSV